jgi:hypothetical protein
MDFSWVFVIKTNGKITLGVIYVVLLLKAIEAIDVGASKLNSGICFA